MHRVGSGRGSEGDSGCRLPRLLAGSQTKLQMTSASVVVKSTSNFRFYWNDLEIVSLPNQLSIAVGK